MAFDVCVANNVAILRRLAPLPATLSGYEFEPWPRLRGLPSVQLGHCILEVLQRHGTRAFLRIRVCAWEGGMGGAHGAVKLVKTDIGITETWCYLRTKVGI